MKKTPVKGEVVVEDITSDDGNDYNQSISSKMPSKVPETVDLSKDSPPSPKIPVFQRVFDQVNNSTDNQPPLDIGALKDPPHIFVKLGDDIDTLTLGAELGFMPTTGLFTPSVMMTKIFSTGTTSTLIGTSSS